MNDRDHEFAAFQMCQLTPTTTELARVLAGHAEVVLDLVEGHLDLPALAVQVDQLLRRVLDAVQQGGGQLPRLLRPAVMHAPHSSVGGRLSC